MGKHSKLLEKIQSGSKNIRFKQFVTLIEAFGFVLDRVVGSHHIYKHPQIKDGFLNLQPRNGQVKPQQIRQFLEMIDTYNLILGEDND